MVHRLIGSADPLWIVDKIFLDSLLFLRVLPGALGRVLDLGAGAGVPGIPLKIVRQDIEMTMLEARQRRVSFLATVARKLSLVGVSIVGARAESVIDQFAGSFDAVVMRCAGAPEQMMATAAKFARTGGVVVASGPPRPRPLRLGRWVTVEGVNRGELRRFAVLETGV